MPLMAYGRLLLLCGGLSACATTVVKTDDRAVWLDSNSGLEWQRCPLGQVWQSQGCRGKVTRYTYQQALQQAGQLDPGQSWRLPSIMELNALLVCAQGHAPSPYPELLGPCRGDFQQPTLDQARFAGVHGFWYWSHSPGVLPRSRWAMYFGTGHSIPSVAESAEAGLWLVRDVSQGPAGEPADP